MASGTKEYVGYATTKEGKNRNVTFKLVNFNGDLDSAKTKILQLSGDKYTALDIREIGGDDVVAPDAILKKPKIK